MFTWFQVRNFSQRKLIAYYVIMFKGRSLIICILDWHIRYNLFARNVVCGKKQKGLERIKITSGYHAKINSNFWRSQICLQGYDVVWLITILYVIIYFLRLSSLLDAHRWVHISNVYWEIFITGFTIHYIKVTDRTWAKAYGTRTYHSSRKRNYLN